jgi:hypothetical protein
VEIPSLVDLPSCMPDMSMRDRHMPKQITFILLTAAIIGGVWIMFTHSENIRGLTLVAVKRTTIQVSILLL